MENNINNKEKFFAQYWGQKVMVSLFKPHWCVFDKLCDNEYLELKPLSSITDEDAINIAIIKFSIFSNCDVKVNNPLNKHETKKVFFNDKDTGKYMHHTEITEWNLDCTQLDYARSKGYALPYMGLSVEEQVSRGWVKLVGIPEGLYIDKNTLK